MSRYIVDNIVGLYGVFASADKELIVSCDHIENAELIANVLNADREGNVYGTVDCFPTLLAHLLNFPQQRVKITKEEAKQMVKADAERRKRGEQEYNEQRMADMQKQIEGLKREFEDYKKRNSVSGFPLMCVCNPVERFYKI